MRTCPNDGTPMQQIPKGGVVIDRCPTCGGVFLDAGELENLERLASNYYAGQHGGGVPPVHQTHYGRGHGGHYGHGHGGHYGQGYGHKRKRKGFLGELFD